MLKLFFIDNSIFDDDAAFEEQLALVDGERREKVKALATREKQNASLAAGIILPLALKACGYSGEVKIERGDWDKPRLVQPKGLFFNLSHSGEMTAVALSDGEVGVDIQKVRPVDMRLAKRFFAPSEYEAIAAAPDPEEAFFRFWTVKEAYLKALGTGLNRPLGSFTVSFGEDGVRVCDPLKDGGWRISEVTAPQGFKAAVCAKEKFDGVVEKLGL